MPIHVTDEDVSSLHRSLEIVELAHLFLSDDDIEQNETLECLAMIFTVAMPILSACGGMGISTVLYSSEKFKEYLLAYEEKSVILFDEVIARMCEYHWCWGNDGALMLLNKQYKLKNRYLAAILAKVLFERLEGLVNDLETISAE